MTTRRFLRVVNFPTRGIGARTIELLTDAARASGRSLYQSVGAVVGKGGANLLAFTGLIDQLRERTRGLTLREIIEQMLDSSGLVDFYKAEKEGAERIENLAELVNAAEAFVTQEGFGKDAVALPVDETGGPGALAVGLPPAPAPVDLTPDAETGEIVSPLAAFLTHAGTGSRRQPGPGGPGRDPADDRALRQGPGIRLRVHHRLEEALFPHENAMSDADGLEEERRLMYVAITRARKRLYLSFSQTRMLHGQTRYNVKSRFLDELPEGALKWLTPRNAGLRLGLCAKEYQQAWQRGSGLGSVVGAGRVAGRPAQPAYTPPPLPAAMQNKAGAGHGLRVGQAVFHTKFGEGVVLTLEGSGPDARAQVNFGRHGAKWLALAIAKLTPIE
jgi:DNA helicase-2/ATP-dependent DNA helicase PcrA